MTKIAIAVAISLPANQSVPILVSCTVSSTPPAPEASRLAICQPQRSVVAMIRLPAVISSSAAMVVGLSPRVRPIAPPGSASTMPGVK